MVFTKYSHDEPDGGPGDEPAGELAHGRRATDRGSDRGRQRPTIPTEYGPLVEWAKGHAGALQSAHVETWHMDRATNVDIDLEVGAIRWQLPDRVATAPAEVLGTWNPEDEVFRWGWDHPSVPRGRAAAAVATRAFADEHGIVELQAAEVVCPYGDTWGLAGSAVLIGELNGAYRFEVESGGLWAYLGFGAITVSPR